MTNIHEPFLQHFRPRRLRFFYSSFKITEETRVLDLGGGLYFWDLARAEGLPVPQITVLNIGQGPAQLPPEVKWVLGDARNTQFESNSFDIVFSNSLIEHLFDWNSQVCMANEVKRLAPAYFVQTPNRSFFVEPHFITPFIHWLPVPVRRSLGPRATVWGWTNGAKRQRYYDMLKEIRLLNMREMMQLFPDARLIRERWLGMVKSIVVVKGGCCKGTHN